MSETLDAGAALKRLASWLNERGIILDDPEEKESHEGKKLIQHVRECWNLSDQILRRLGTSDRLRFFCFSLCVAHDVGKLDPEWQIRKKKKPRWLGHAQKGWELLNKMWEEGELTRLLPLPSGYEEALLYAVLKHHSSLFPPHDIPDLQRKLRRFLSGNVDLAIGIADVIGVFKLADIMSALDCPSSFYEKLLSQYEWSEQFGARIDVGIRCKAEDKGLSFDLRKYELQRDVASLRSKHLIFVAPTGWGKTAVALLRIKYMKPRRVFYVLPTITAIREFEKALRDRFGPEYVGEYFYFADVEYLVGREELEEPEYPMTFYRYFIPKIVITTIDQLLLATLQFGRYNLRRYNLRDSLLIFDEFHLLTPQMIGALNAIFEELTDIYNFSALLMSATPSKTYVDALKETLKERGGVERRVLRDQYEQLRRHRIKRVDKPLLDFLQEKESELKGRRLLVISNTVEGAVQAYNILRRAGRRGVRLIHGRFAYTDRRRKEESISEAETLVSTQVAEVSLDVSYDVLVTELAPIPSLIQRFGRVNRYRKRAEGTNIYICEYGGVKPYSWVELLATGEVLDKLITDLQNEGEQAYLDVLDSYYEKLPREFSIEKMYRNARETLDNRKHFYCIRETEEFEKIFGREPSFLAVPSNYSAKVRELREKMKGKTYEERRELLANLKSYLISVPPFIIKDGRWDEDLGLFVVGVEKYAYDPDRGLVKEELLYI